LCCSYSFFVVVVNAVALGDAGGAGQPRNFYVVLRRATPFCVRLGVFSNLTLILFHGFIADARAALMCDCDVALTKVMAYADTTNLTLSFRNVILPSQPTRARR
jgi:hypothetical protein